MTKIKSKLLSIIILRFFKKEAQKLIREFYDGESLEINNTLQDIREQFNEIKKVEQGVKVLLELIQQFQEIIMGQTEIINSIENNVIQIRDHIERGVKHVENAKDLMMNAQDKLCCVFFIFLIISIISLHWLLNLLIY
jgi:t-SNARE complex subunit (syntaxin)